MKRILFILLLAILTLPVFADPVLDKFVQELETSALQSNITVSIVQPNSTPIFTNAYILLSGERFYIKADGIEMAYNGQYLSTYQADFNEITLSIPTQAELNEFSPILGIRTLMRDSQVTSTKLPNGNYRIVLKNNNVQPNIQITVTLTAAYLPTEIVAKEANNTVITLHFDNPEYLHTAPVYEITKPNAKINDLR